MKKTIYIHAGAGKTGTTAIQEFLFLNEKQLLKDGLYIPDIGRQPSNKHIVHHFLAGWFGKLEQNNVKVLNLWNEISQLGYKSILISSEFFHHPKLFVKNDSNLLTLIKEKVSEHFIIKIIYYIRPEEQWLQSAYEQWIKSGSKRDGESIHDFIKRPRITLAEQVYKLAEIFGKNNIIVKPFEKSQFIGGNLFSDFLNNFHIEYKSEYILPSRNSNPRLSYDALEFKRVANMVCSDKKQASVLNEHLMKYSDAMDNQSSSLYRKSGLLTLKEKNKIRESNDKLYQSIARDFLNIKEGVLFKEKDTLKTITKQYDLEDLTKISSYLFINLYQKIELLENSLKKLNTNNEYK